jgi:hypothetical protein
VTQGRWISWKASGRHGWGWMRGVLEDLETQRYKERVREVRLQPAREP